MQTPIRLPILICLIALLACSPSGKEAQTAVEPGLLSGGTFRRGNAAEPETLDPHRAIGTPAYDILRDLFEGLTTETVRSELRPGAAERWEISEDGTRYVFHLRHDGRWSNGEPVTAHDFVRSFRRVLDPKTAAPNAHMLAPILNAPAIVDGDLAVDQLGVAALDALTLEIRLSTSTPYFLGLLNHSATYPVHSSNTVTIHRQNLISNGSYTLVDWRPNEYIDLVKNPHYWDHEKVAIDRVRFLPIEDPFTELHQYRASEIDYTSEIPSGNLDWVKENIPGEFRIAPYLGVYYFIFNLYDEPFKSNRKLRQALSMAIDREVLVRTVTGRGELPAYGWVPVGLPGYANQSYSWKDTDQQERAEQARRLYAEAGFASNEPPRVRVLYDTHSTHRKIAKTVANMWKSVLGIETDLIAVEWMVYLQSRKTPKGPQVTRSAWVGDYNDPNAFLEIFKSSHNQNVGGYSNATYDQITDAAAREIDIGKRRQLLQEAERVLLDDYALIPVYFYVSKHLVKPYVEGFVPNVMNHNYSRHYRLSTPDGT